MGSTADAAKRLWNLCNVLRDDGITYHQYISELTLILFFKLASQLGVQGQIPPQYRWQSLSVLSSDSLMTTFKDAIKVLADSPDATVSDMFIDNETRIRNPESLWKLIRGIDTIDWEQIEPSSIGDIYESLIDRNAQESRYGAGQYFTPRALVEAMVRVTAPNPRDSVYDPAAGTAGFLIAAGVHSRNSDGRQCLLSGNELVREVQRMGQMNIHLHGLDAQLRNVDTLAGQGGSGAYSLCLTNPPFGIKSDVNPIHQRELRFPTSNKQLAFLQHIYECLRSQGRAAVIVPDNVLFETGVAASIRTFLLDNFNLHTILRLPPGIFYATGVKTSALFFCKTEPTETTWIYDLRSGNGTFTKKHPLRIEDLEEFISLFGPDPLGSSSRMETQSFRSFSRDDIRDIEDRLDLLGTPIRESHHTSGSATLELIARELEQAALAAKSLQALIDKADRND